MLSGEFSQFCGIENVEIKIKLYNYAMKIGAYDFLEKTFNDQSFLDLIQKAIRTGRTSARKTCTSPRLLKSWKT